MARLRVSSVAALLVVLLQSVNPAASQTDTPSPSNASNSSNSLPFYQEYNFTYPNSPSPQVLLVNYKDTINVSWTSVYPHHPPLLMLECWHRNITTSPLYASRAPDLLHILLQQAPPNMTSFPLNLTAYEHYSPCDLTLGDSNTNNLPINGKSGPNGFGAASSPFIISNVNSSDHNVGTTWSITNPAPEQNSTVGAGGAPESAAAHLRAAASLINASVVGALLAVWAGVVM